MSQLGSRSGGGGSFLGLGQSQGGMSDSTSQLVGPAKGDTTSLARKRFRAEPVTVSGISCVSTAWLTATLLFTAGCCVALALPVWMRADRSEALVDTAMRTPKPSDYIYDIEIGMTWFQANYSNDGGVSWIQRSYHYLEYTEDRTDVLPSSASDISVLLAAACVYGFGCGLLIISFFIGIVAYCKPRIKGVSIFLTAFWFQIVAAVCIVAGIFIFPVCFGSEFYKNLCGRTYADIYQAGVCEIGYAYIIAMISTSLTLYLPSLAIFSMNTSDGLNAYLCC